jgi:hypothetical protein
MKLKVKLRQGAHSMHLDAYWCNSIIFWYFDGIVYNWGYFNVSQYIPMVS